MGSVTGPDDSCGWIFGATGRPTDSRSFGYSHRSEVKHDIRGTATFDVPGTAAFVTAGGAYVTGPAGAKLTLPSVDSFSATWEVNEKLALLAEATLPGWDSLEEIHIEFDNPAQHDSSEDGRGGQGRGGVGKC